MIEIRNWRKRKAIHYARRVMGGPFLLALLLDQAIFVIRQQAYQWKLLDSQKTHYGISQADLYQMAVYQYKYPAQNVTLLYIPGLMLLMQPNRFLLPLWMD